MIKTEDMEKLLDLVGFLNQKVEKTVAEIQSIQETKNDLKFVTFAATDAVEKFTLSLAVGMREEIANHLKLEASSITKEIEKIHGYALKIEEDAKILRHSRNSIRPFQLQSMLFAVLGAFAVGVVFGVWLVSGRVTI